MSHPFRSSLTHISLLWQFLKSETLVGKPIEGFANCLRKGILVCGKQESHTMLYLVSESQPIALCVYHKNTRREGSQQPGVFSKSPYKAAVYFGRSSWKLVSTRMSISIYSSGILDPGADWCPGRLPSWPAQLAWCLRTLGET